MQHFWNAWPAKSPDHHRNPAVDYSQVHKLKDSPPYDNVYATNHGIEAIRTQSEKFWAGDDYSRAQVHKLKDSPPYDDVYSTNHGIEAIRTQSEKFRAGDDYSRARRAPESPESSEYSTGSNGRSYGNGNYGREYRRESSYNEEDVNTEAEDFIREERQRLGLLKWKSTSSSIN